MQSQPVTSLPGTSARAVVPADNVVFAPSLIYVGGVGNVNVMPADQAGASVPTPVLFTAPVVGQSIPLLCIQVLATNTTATLMVRVF
ncbi:MAG: hypothetical protein RL030_1778 [Pseudomonadota bacterium]|jgi:hypothetical protein